MIQYSSPHFFWFTWNIRVIAYADDFVDNSDSPLIWNEKMPSERERESLNWKVVMTLAFEHLSPAYASPQLSCAPKYYSPASLSMPLAFSLSRSLSPAQCLCVCPCRLSFGSLNAAENIAREENAGSMELYWNVSRLEPMKSRLACHCISLLSVSEGERRRGVEGRSSFASVMMCLCARRYHEGPIVPVRAHNKRDCLLLQTEHREPEISPTATAGGKSCRAAERNVGALPPYWCWYLNQRLMEPIMIRCLLCLAPCVY